MKQTIRLTGFDYGSDGGYFITICSHERRQVFSTIKDGVVELSILGKIILEEWENTSRLRPYVAIDELVIMPDHIHGILFINKNPDSMHILGNDVPRFPIGYRNSFGPQRKNLASIIRGFKSSVTRRANQIGLQLPVWQSRYHDWVIQTPEAYERFAEYIRKNPGRWQLHLKESA